MFQPNDQSDSNLDEREPKQGEFVFLKVNDTQPLEVIRVMSDHYVVHNEWNGETFPVRPDDLTGEIVVKRATPLRSEVNPLHEVLVRGVTLDVERAYKSLQYFGSTDVEVSGETRQAARHHLIQLINHAAYYKLLPAQFKYNQGILVY